MNNKSNKFVEFGRAFYHRGGFIKVAVITV